MARYFLMSRGMFITMLSMILFGAWIPGVYGASHLSVGNFVVTDREQGSEKEFGQCRVFTGPHGDFLEAGELLMEISDSIIQNGVDFEISKSRLTFKKTGIVHSLLSKLLPGSQKQKKNSIDLDDKLDRGKTIRFRPDKPDLEEDVKAFLAARGREVTQVRIKRARASVDFEGEDGDEIITCNFRVWAEVYENNIPVRGLLKISFKGKGQRFTDFHGRFDDEEGLALGTSGGAGESLLNAPAAAALAQGSCPSFVLSEDKWPDDGSRIPSQCPTPDCLVSFAGYKWWTNYHYRGKDKYNSFYFDNGQAWSPRNVLVSSEGLHLKVAKDDLGGGSQWASSEAVALFKDDAQRTPASLGYGRYLVAARLKTAPAFRDLDTNVAFGVFTYQKDESGGQNNPNRELDLVEISRWGAPPCEVLLDPIRLCTGHAQHTLQKWDGHTENLHRFDLDAGVNEVTLVMDWPGANQQVTFKQYNGIHPTLAAADGATPERSWTTSPEQNPWVPASNCQNFHLNLWLGNFQHNQPNPDIRGVHPPPVSNAPQEVVVTSFEYQP